MRAGLAKASDGHLTCPAWCTAYQSFLQLLLAAAGGADGGAAPAPAKKKAAAGALDARTALRCMCCLLQALPQFNYRSDLLRALVPRLAAEDVAEAGPAVAAVTSVLREDSHGEATLEAVQLLADLVKRLGCTAPAHTLDALKAVRFDENLGARLKDEREKDKPLSQKQRNRKWIEERRRMRDDAKRAARKPGADAKGAARGSGGGDDDEGEVEDRTLRDFDALPDTTARLQLQTSTLEAVRVHLRCFCLRVRLLTARSPLAADVRDLFPRAQRRRRARPSHGTAAGGCHVRGPCARRAPHRLRGGC